MDKNVLRTDTENEQAEQKKAVQKEFEDIGRRMRNTFLTSTDGKETFKWLLQKLGHWSEEWTNPEIDLAFKNLSVEILGIMGIYRTNTLDTVIRQYAEMVVKKGDKE